MEKVRDIMTTPVRKLHRDTNLCEAECIFVSEKISAAPIVDDFNHIVGLVSKTDITRFDSSGDDPYYARVHEIANPRVVSIEPSASIKQAAHKMLREHVHHLVVMKKHRVVGMLSSFDFVKLAVKHADEACSTDSQIDSLGELTNK